MKALVSKGKANIILGNFLDESGEPFNSSFPSTASYLTADVLSGSKWTDFPSNYSGISLVISDGAKKVLDRTEGCDDLLFVRTIVREFPKTCFWTLSDTLNVWVAALEDSEELASRTFRLRQAFAMSGRHFVIDESMYPVLSDDLAAKLQAAGLVGFECVNCS